MIHVSADSNGEGLFYVIEQVNPSLENEENFGQGKITVERDEVEAILQVITNLEEMEVEIDVEKS